MNEEGRGKPPRSPTAHRRYRRAATWPCRPSPIRSPESAPRRQDFQMFLAIHDLCQATPSEARFLGRPSTCGSSAIYCRTAARSAIMVASPAGRWLRTWPDTRDRPRQESFQQLPRDDSRQLDFHRAFGAAEDDAGATAAREDREGSGVDAKPEPLIVCVHRYRRSAEVRKWIAS